MFAGLGRVVGAKRRGCSVRLKSAPKIENKTYNHFTPIKGQISALKPHRMHASGHASGKELHEFIDRVKPKNLIPIHTEKLQLFKNRNGKLVLPKPGGAIQK